MGRVPFHGRGGMVPLMVIGAIHDRLSCYRRDLANRGRENCCAFFFEKISKVSSTFGELCQIRPFIIELRSQTPDGMEAISR